MSIFRALAAAWESASWTDRGMFLLILTGINLLVELLWSVVWAVWP